MGHIYYEVSVRTPYSTRYCPALRDPTWLGVLQQIKAESHHFWSRLYSCGYGTDAKSILYHQTQKTESQNCYPPHQKQNRRHPPLCKIAIPHLENKISGIPNRSPPHKKTFQPLYPPGRRNVDFIWGRDARDDAVWTAKGPRNNRHRTPPKRKTE